MMAQMQAKLVKEKQTNEKVIVVCCASYVLKPEQHHERWLRTLDCSSDGPSDRSGYTLHLIANHLIPLSEFT
jgi:hypothetical protein